MSELQVGGLALVIGCTSNPIDVGKIVQLDSFLEEGDETPDGGFTKRALWLATGDVLHRMVDGYLVTSKYGLYQTKNLIPIRPEQDPLDVTHKEELHA